jgi:hypothetical protein
VEGCKLDLSLSMTEEYAEDQRNKYKGFQALNKNGTKILEQIIFHTWTKM